MITGMHVHLGRGLASENIDADGMHVHSRVGPCTATSRFDSTGGGASSSLHPTHERTGLIKTDIVNRAITLYEFVDARSMAPRMRSI
jgi:hypothetical protein